MDPLSLRAYAKHRGVSLKAVQKAITSGRIAKRADGLIDPEVADLNWARNTGPRPQTSQNPELAPTHHSAQRHAEGRAPEPGPSGRLETGLDYSRARAIRENYLARLAKLEFEERSGKLLNKAEVKVAQFNLYRQFRDRILNIPDRIAPDLAAETDIGKVYNILATEIRDALTEFADAASAVN